MNPADDRASGLDRMLPFAIVASAAVLFASNFMTTFELTPPGGEALLNQSAADQHFYAQAILAVFAVIAMFAAISAGSKPAATAVAACGVVALLIFLLLVLPDAGNVGTLDDPRQNFFEAEAVPQTGFWLELIGALGLALAGAALATMDAEQIAKLRPGGGRKPKERRERPARGEAAEAPAEKPSAAEAPAKAQAKR